MSREPTAEQIEAAARALYERPGDGITSNDTAGDDRARFDAVEFLASALATAADVEFAQLSDDEKHPWRNHASGLLFEIGMHEVADAMDAGEWPWRDNPAPGDAERIETAGWVEIEFVSEAGRAWPRVVDWDQVPDEAIGSRHTYAVSPLTVRPQEGGKA